MNMKLKYGLLIISSALVLSAAAAPEFCNLDAEQGPCKALMPRFFFNSTSGQCQEFIYGGCKGNDNNFGNRTECERACMSAASEAQPAELPTIPNDSNNSTIDSANSQPAVGMTSNDVVPEMSTQLVDTRPNAAAPVGVAPARNGTQQTAASGPSNNMPAAARARRDVSQITSNQTTTTTNVTVTKQQTPPDVVGEQQDQQNTVNITPKANSLVILSPSNAAVVVETNSTTNATSIAVEPAATTNAPPPAVTTTAAPDSLVTTNNTLENETPTVTTKTTPSLPLTTAPEGVPKPCLLPSETGPCRALFRRFYFNPNTSACEIFYWGGCDANANNFETVSDCNEACLGPNTTTTTAEKESDGLNNKTTTGINNEFRTLNSNTAENEAEQTTSKIAEQRSTNFNTEFDAAAARLRLRQAAIEELTNDEDINQELSTHGKPQQASEAEHMQPSMSSYGFGGKPVETQPRTTSNQVASDERNGPLRDQNENSYHKITDELHQLPLKCQLQQMTGPCKAAIKRYFFNLNKMQCELFMYGGCSANANNFESEAQCLQECTAKPQVRSVPRPVSVLEMQQQEFLGPQPQRGMQPQMMMAMPPQQRTYNVVQQKQPAPYGGLPLAPPPPPPPAAASPVMVAHYAEPPSVQLQHQQQRQYFQQLQQQQPPPQQQQLVRSGQPTFGNNPGGFSAWNSDNQADASPQPQAIDWRAASGSGSGGGGARRAYRHVSLPAAPPPTSQMLTFPSMMPTMRVGNTPPLLGVADREWRTAKYQNGGWSMMDMKMNGIGNDKQFGVGAPAMKYDTA